MSREMALVAYRNLLRSTRIAFQGDINVLSAARAEVRKNFESNRSLSAGSEEYTKQITHAEEVAKFLRENVVQGQATDAGKYRASSVVKNISSADRLTCGGRATDTRTHGARG
ncbi:hypothetical protein LEMA_P061120.1 [Plenodomus lingam JN3]|uniref:Mitochondrial zinc maintenance protein 1, mitochondrial n=1 Tax=Leptosphaeria maculans (strain JN3 / isolate v23.1.3 / race Av1-4-5-6-7-8) TaxID=985895 RepID=E4ZIQ7_LEPMJ|nr:hypothetical protein LEMA_P061120.1 [Plenodomus lingam JN3]CBX91078.1 hypothetical protein LEMA_P061120.1 [Plenodomus lingam JN3]